MQQPPWPCRAVAAAIFTRDMLDVPRGAGARCRPGVGCAGGSPNPNSCHVCPAQGGPRLTAQCSRGKIISVRLTKKPLSESETQYCCFKRLDLLHGMSRFLNSWRGKSCVRFFGKQKIHWKQRKLGGRCGGIQKTKNEWEKRSH